MVFQVRVSWFACRVWSGEARSSTPCHHGVLGCWQCKGCKEKYRCLRFDTESALKEEKGQTIRGEMPKGSFERATVR